MALQKFDSGLGERLSALEPKVFASERTLNALRQDFERQAVSQREYRDYKIEVGGRLQDLQNGLTNAGSATAQLRDEITKTVNDAEKRVDAAVGCQTDAIVKIRSEFTALADKAFGKEA